MKKKERSILRNELLWVCIAAILILPLVGILVTNSNHSWTGAAVQTISYLKAGEKLTFEIRTAEDLGWQFMTITLLDTVKNQQITIKEDSTIKFDCPFYSKAKVNSAAADKFGAMILEFKLKVDKMTQLGLSSNMHLTVNGNLVPTTMQESKNGYAYYRATGNFEEGEYVIGEKCPEPVLEKPAPPIKYEPEEPVIAPEAIQQPTPHVQPELGFFAKIAQFFSNLFG
jgi:hypothetical protein